MAEMENEVFVCLDCETTGLDIKQDAIIEVGVVKFTLNEVLESYETLIDPQAPIPKSSTAIHNITDEMVQEKPTIKDVIPVVMKIVDRHIIVGHGIKFDMDIIAEAAKKTGLPCTITNNHYIDTLRLARLYGDSPKNSLSELAKHFNIEFEGAHRAMSDVLANIQVFRHLAKKFKSSRQIFKTLSRPILMKTMPLGKHKGRSLRDVPLDYLLWAANKDFDQDLLFSIRSEIKRRKQGNLFNQAGNPFNHL